MVLYCNWCGRPCVPKYRPLGQSVSLCSESCYKHHGIAYAHEILRGKPETPAQLELEDHD